MTQARATLIPPGHAVFVHVTTRCVRRAWLFGRDRFSNRRYDHRCGLIEARVRELAEVFAVGVYAYAWMANHFHLALAVLPDAARGWSDDEVGESRTGRKAPMPVDHAANIPPQKVRLVAHAPATTSRITQRRSPASPPVAAQQAAPMTQARATLIPPGHAVFVHVTTRCVRRAWLFGRDRFSNRRYDHRCGLIEARVRELADVFAVGVYAFAWMANHFHLALAVRPDAVRAWSDNEVIDRWQQIYRSKCEQRNAERRAQMLADPEQMRVTRERLASLSWFMKCLNEHVSKRFNAEDQARGHFWEARFKSQVLLDERALLAAMAYVDLNPIRAGIACNLMASRNTSIRQRCKGVRGNAELANEVVRPIWGVAASTMPPITVAEYIELVDDTGRQIRKDKRGVISAAEPRALQKLGISPDHWTRKVKGVGSGFWRVVETVDDIQEKAAAMQQQFLRGIGFARGLVFG